MWKTEKLRNICFCLDDGGISSFCCFKKDKDKDKIEIDRIDVLANLKNTLT
ncbi:hypothetical protein L6278_01020 [Candidatus Parcubacteria bacterium]|nr:hypothetical protein [Patescibacteria group bacterium]MCG2686701.1 hypothetical protein [Candidatus Parcubacteria bacterium]